MAPDRAAPCRRSPPTSPRSASPSSRPSRPTHLGPPSRASLKTSLARSKSGRRPTSRFFHRIYSRPPRKPSARLMSFSRWSPAKWCLTSGNRTNSALAPPHFATRSSSWVAADHTALHTASRLHWQGHYWILREEIERPDHKVVPHYRHHRPILRARHVMKSHGVPRHDVCILDRP